MTKAFAAGLVATAILCSIPAQSAHAGAPRTHDGFMLRLSAGGGAGNTQAESDGTIELSGTATDLNLAIGGMIRPNFAIHGTIFGWSVGSPDVKVTGSSLGSGAGTIDGTVTMSGFGPGVTYYFMPANVYLSGSVGFGSLSFSSDGQDGSSDTGIALDLTLGKEWWVAKSWGLGAAGGFTYHSIPDQGSTWDGTSFALRFTATMN